MIDLLYKKNKQYQRIQLVIIGCYWRLMYKKNIDEWIDENISTKFEFK